MMFRNKRNRAFSLVELVVVIVIIGIIAAMAIPRFSRGTAGASDSALMGNLAMLRTAIDTYYYEHNGAWPTQTGFVDQMTTYSSIAGATNATRTSIYKFGPYLAAVPPCPVGDQTDPTAVAFYTSGAFPDPKVAADTGGWIYNTTTGEIIANTNVTDQGGTAYCDY